MRNETVTFNPIQDVSFQTTDEALVFLQVALFIGCRTQLGKSVNNDTKDNIKQNCNHDQEERQVVSKPDEEGVLVLVNVSLGWQELTDTSTHSDAIIEGRQEAMHERHTHGRTLLVEQRGMQSVVVVVVSNELESNSCVYVKEDEGK